MSALLDYDGKQLPSVAPLPSVPKSVASNRLGAEPAQVVNLIVTQIMTTALRLANATSIKDFKLLRSEVFPKYAKLCVGMANILNAEEPGALKKVADESITEFERIVREDASATFLKGQYLDEAQFLLSTLRRTYRLIGRINATPAPKQSVPEDRETAAEFNYHILWAQLHLDAILVAAKMGLALAEEIVAELLVGFRAVVMAYSCARQGVRIREFPKQFDFSGVTWDAEDEDLARQSTQERESTLGSW
jgi:hypothetical protein